MSLASQQLGAVDRKSDSNDNKTADFTSANELRSLALTVRLCNDPIFGDESFCDQSIYGYRRYLSWTTCFFIFKCICSLCFLFLPSCTGLTNNWTEGRLACPRFLHLSAINPSQIVAWLTAVVYTSRRGGAGGGRVGGREASCVLARWNGARRAVVDASADPQRSINTGPAFCRPHKKKQEMG